MGLKTLSKENIRHQSLSYAAYARAVKTVATASFFAKVLVDKGKSV